MGDIETCVREKNVKLRQRHRRHPIQHAPVTRRLKQSSRLPMHKGLKNHDQYAWGERDILSRHADESRVCVIVHAGLEGKAQHFLAQLVLKRRLLLLCRVFGSARAATHSAHDFLQAHRTTTPFGTQYLSGDRLGAAMRQHIQHDTLTVHRMTKPFGSHYLLDDRTPHYLHPLHKPPLFTALEPIPCCTRAPVA